MRKVDDDDLRLVVEREHLLLQADVRRDTGRVLSLLHPDFREHGSSGRVWDRSSIAEATSSATESIGMSSIEARRLGPDAVLVTYRSEGSDRRALRSSVWVRENGAWVLLFHQGTLAAD